MRKMMVITICMMAILSTTLAFAGMADKIAAKAGYVPALEASKSLKTSQDALKTSQDALKTSQDALKTSQEALKVSQRDFEASQEVLKVSQKKLKASQEAFNSSLEIIKDIETSLKLARKDLANNQNRQAFGLLVLAAFLTILWYGRKRSNRAPRTATP